MSKINNINDLDLEKSLQLSLLNKYSNFILNKNNSYNKITRKMKKQSILAVKTRNMVRKEIELKKKLENDLLSKEKLNQKRLKQIGDKLKQRRASKRLAAKDRVDYSGLDENEGKREASNYDYTSILDKIPDISSLNPELFKSVVTRLNSTVKFDELFNIKIFENHQKLDDKCILVCEYLKSNDIKMKKKILLKFYKRDNGWRRNCKENKFKINDNGLLCREETIVVPKLLILKLMKYYHESLHTGHGGIEMTYQLLKRNYWWQELKSDVYYWVRCCNNCQKSRGIPSFAALEPWFPSGPGELVFADHSGPYHKTLLFLLIMDSYTNILKIVPVYTSGALVACQGIMNGWIPNQGVPVQMGFDQGGGFISDINQEFFDISGIENLYATYNLHLATGLIENAVRKVNAVYRSLNIELNGELTNGEDRNLAVNKILALLPQVEFRINMSIKTGVGFEPHFLDKGRKLRIFADVPAALEMIKKRAEKGESVNLIPKCQG